MTLADKRKVIEVLLCCGDPASPDATPEVTESMGLDECYQRMAFKEYSLVERETAFRDGWDGLGLALPYTEAAYRLIESSPTLRREWFGAK